MPVSTLHPIEPEIVRQYVRALNGVQPPEQQWLSWWRDDLVGQLEEAEAGSERAANRLTAGLVCALAQAGPVFMLDNLSLSGWEAMVERGVGMMLRPPSRLFIDAGCAVRPTRTMPIRIDPNIGAMGGSWVPDRLIGNLQTLLDQRLDRIAVRLNDAGHDPLAAIGMLAAATDYAAVNHCGLLEASDVFGPDGEAPFAIRLVTSATMPADGPLRDRIRTALIPASKPGLFNRLFGRNGSSRDAVSDGRFSRN